MPHAELAPFVLRGIISISDIKELIQPKYTPAIVPNEWTLTTEKKIGNIFFYSIGGGISTKDKIAYNHPAIFPEKLVADQINTWTNENDLVYDPFMGSGVVSL